MSDPNGVLRELKTAEYQHRIARQAVADREWPKAGNGAFLCSILGLHIPELLIEERGGFSFAFTRCDRCGEERYSGRLFLPRQEV